MPTTTVSDDGALLDAIERQIMDCDMSVTLKRCWVNVGRPSHWQVSFETDASAAALAKAEGKQPVRTVWAKGGGVTLREALQAAFVDVVERNFVQRVEPWLPDDERTP